MNALARRDHGSEDLRRKLLAKGFGQAVVQPLIERLCAEKLVDDDRYVEHFVAYHASRGQGPLRVGAELRRLGMPAALIEDGIARYPDWMLQLRHARQKKFGTALPDNRADHQRQSRFLGYRGFTGAQIRAALGFDAELDSIT